MSICPFKDTSKSKRRPKGTVIGASRLLRLHIRTVHTILKQKGGSTTLAARLNTLATALEARTASTRLEAQVIIEKEYGAAAVQLLSISCPAAEELFIEASRLETDAATAKSLATRFMAEGSA